MTASQRKKRGPPKTALRLIELRTAYHALAFLAKVFEKPFWFFEERRGHLMDRIDNERSQT
jgi:hypothetical protein